MMNHEWPFVRVAFCPGALSTSVIINEHDDDDDNDDVISYTVKHSGGDLVGVLLGS